MKLLLKISFIGSAYCGFQCQKNKRAVQNVLTEASNELFGEKCLVTGCSRTDSGVHAKGFYVTVEPENKESEISIPLDKIHLAYRAHLPSDISVIGAAAVPDGFHPRYSCKGKNYIYRIWDGLYDNPFEAGRSYRCPFKITDEMLRKMQKAAEGIVGEHDFSAFMAKGSKITDAVRCVTKAELYRENENLLVFSVTADGFLYNMVRIIVGTLLDTAAGRIDCDDIPGIIEGKDRTVAGATAPPEGLYLNEVYYGGISL